MNVVAVVRRRGRRGRRRGASAGVASPRPRSFSIKAARGWAHARTSTRTRLGTRFVRSFTRTLFEALRRAQENNVYSPLSNYIIHNFYILLEFRTCMYHTKRPIRFFFHLIHMYKRILQRRLLDQRPFPFVKRKVRDYVRFAFRKMKPN